MPRAFSTHQPRKAKAKQHNPRGKSPTERQQRRAMHTGSKGWKLQRMRVLTRDGFTCKTCGHYGDQVDHITDNAHEIVGDDELQTLCIGCHSRATALHSGGFGNKPRPR